MTDIPKPLTVTELTRAFKEATARQFRGVVVMGEVAEFKPHRSGHWYFSLRDTRSVLKCVMFRGANQRLGWRPEIGEQVKVLGELDIYPERGTYNLLVRRMARLGVGDLQAKLEALKKKLQAEGLFDVSRKRPLPKIPRAIGVATSPTGAALQDIRKVLGRRFPSIPIYLAPCRVQGAHSVPEIVESLRILNAHGRSDVLLLARGGGSKEDLAAFNEESVVRAVARSAIPVVCAVGHEVDTSLADLAADVRAATPSHAAELVVPDRLTLLAAVREQEQRLLLGMRRDLQRRQDKLRHLVPKNPRQRLSEARLRCDDLHDRLIKSAQRDQLRRTQRVAHLTGRLDALSPLAVLSRGYALAMKDAHAIRDSQDISVGDVVDLRFLSGRAQAEIVSIDD